MAKRPDWRNPSEYPDPKTATFSMFAWEFLRRNIEFQAQCKAARGATDEDTIAREWGLGRFKHYRENFSDDKEPVFTAGTPPEIHVGPAPRAFGLLAGEIAIVFDIRAAEYNRGIITAQFKTAREKVDAAFSAQLKKRKKAGVNMGPGTVKKPRTDHMPSLLRILDALAKQVDRTEIAQVIFGDKPRDYPDRTRQKAFDAMVRRATHLANRAHIELPSRDITKRRAKA